jgi:hypothetical protein
MYAMIKRWYETFLDEEQTVRLWSAERVQQAVGRFITQEQADEILGN